MSLLSKPSRSYGDSHLAGLDHLRAFAIVFVLLFHARLFPHPEWIDVVGKFGWTGVDLFFVLSGYLISSNLFQQMANAGTIILSDFFIKRFFRIIPAYLTVVAIYFLIPAFREREALAPLWKYLTFTQNFGLDLRVQGTFSHAWSLCIEEQFYFLLPVILVLFISLKIQKVGVWLLALLFIGGFVARIASWVNFIVPLIDADGFGLAWYKYIYYPTYNRLDGLLMGISIAALFQFRPLIKERVSGSGNALFFCGLLILIVAYIVCVDEQTFTASVFGFPLVAMGYGAIVAAAICPSCFLYKFTSSITTNIATLSFAVYLTHKGVIHVTQIQLSKLGLAMDGNLMLLLCTINCFLAAFLLNRIVEQPFLKLRKRILSAS